MRRSFVLFSIALLIVACSKPALGPDGCPKDLLAARGGSCETDGMVCTGGSSSHMLMCSSSKWTEMDAPPPPPPPSPSPPPK